MSMSSDDPLDGLHERIGQTAIGQMDLWDEELFSAWAEVADPMMRFARMLISRGVSPKDRVNLLVGIAIATAMDENP